MPASVGLFVFGANLGRQVTMRGWRGAGCALALGFVCACIAPGAALAQASSDAKAEASKPKTASPKKHVKAAGTQAKSNTATTHSSKSKYSSSHKSGRRKTTARGQQKIDAERAQAIQEALIREHYLSGAAAGTWNQSSEEAMRRYQADHGWQSKTVPDSRALISLGLGPSHDQLLNPESAMVTGPFAPRSNSPTPDSHSADPGARVNKNPPAAPASATTPNHDSSGPQ